MNKKLVIGATLPGLVMALSLAPAAAFAALVQLTATGTITGGDGSGIYNGTVPVTVPTGTPLTVAFLIDTDVFPTGAVGASGETLFNPAGAGGCRSVSLPQDPLQASMMGATVTVGGVILQTQTAGNQRNCDFVSMNSNSGVGDALSMQQDAYDSQIVYYTDGDLTTVSATPTLYHITENRVDLVTLTGYFENDPFSADEVLTELAQTFTLNSFYGTSLFTEFGRGRYICSDPGGAGYRCVNEPLIDGAQYILYGTITGLEGTVVPAPATFGLFGTAFASLVLAARRRLRRKT